MGRNAHVIPRFARDDISEACYFRTQYAAESGHRRLLESGYRFARLAHVGLKLRVRGSPRVGDEQILGGRVRPPAKALENARALHRPEDVVKTVAASRCTGPAAFESPSGLAISPCGYEQRNERHAVLVPTLVERVRRHRELVDRERGVALRKR